MIFMIVAMAMAMPGDICDHLSMAMPILNANANPLLRVKLCLQCNANPP